MNWIESEKVRDRERERVGGRKVAAAPAIRRSRQVRAKPDWGVPYPSGVYSILVLGLHCNCFSLPGNRYV